MSVVIFMLAYKYLVHEIEKSIHHKQKFNNNNNSNQQTCLIPPALPKRTEIKVFLHTKIVFPTAS